MKAIELLQHRFVCLVCKRTGKAIYQPDVVPTCCGQPMMKTSGDA